MTASRWSIFCNRVAGLGRALPPMHAISTSASGHQRVDDSDQRKFAGVIPASSCGRPRTAICRIRRRRSLDHPIGAQHHRLRNPDADRAGHFQVDYQFKSRGLLDRQIGGLGTVENPVDEVGAAAIELGVGSAVADRAVTLRRMNRLAQVSAAPAKVRSACAAARPETVAASMQPAFHLPCVQSPASTKLASPEPSASAAWPCCRPPTERSAR